MIDAQAVAEKEFDVWVEIAGTIRVKAADAFAASEKVDRSLTPQDVAELLGDEMGVAFPEPAKDKDAVAWPADETQ